MEMSYLSKRCLSSSILNTLNKKTWGLKLSKGTQTETEAKYNTRGKRNIGTQTQSEENPSFTDKNSIKKVKSESDISNLTELRFSNGFSSVKKKKNVISIYHFRQCDSYENINKSLIKSPSLIPVPKWKSPEEIKTFLENPKFSRRIFEETTKRNIKIPRKKLRKIRFKKSYRRKYAIIRKKKEAPSSGTCFFKNKMKNYYVLTIELLVKIFRMLTDIGLTTKMFLKNFYEIIQQLNFQQLSSNQSNSMKNQAEFEILHSRIENLEMELTKVKNITKKTDENSENITKLNNLYDSLNEEVNSLRSKFERENFEEKLNDSNEEAMSISRPPPPPPLPPTPLILNKNNCCSSKFIKVISKSEKCFNRPLIKLEDILKVKLRKIQSV